MSKWRRTSAHATVSGIAIFSSRVGSLFVANLRLNHCLDHIPYSFIDLPSDVRDYVIDNKTVPLSQVRIYYDYSMFYILGS